MFSIVKGLFLQVVFLKPTSLRPEGKYHSTVTTLPNLSAFSTSISHPTEAGDGLNLVLQTVLPGGLAPQGQIRTLSMGNGSIYHMPKKESRRTRLGPCKSHSRSSGAASKGEEENQESGASQSHETKGDMQEVCLVKAAGRFRMIWSEKWPIDPAQWRLLASSMKAVSEALWAPPSPALPSFPSWSPLTP